MAIAHPGDAKPFIVMGFAPRVIDGDVFKSQCSKVAWWNATSSNPKPGELSSYISLITGHMACGKTAYSIIHLDKARKGDILLVEYDSGDAVTAVARDDVVSRKKAELNKLPYFTVNPASAQVIRVSTCDTVSNPARPDGHADDSYAVLFDRIS